MTLPIDQYDTHFANIVALVEQSAHGHFRGALQIELKTDESPVTQADREIEAKVREYLKAHFPQDGIFGEEFGIEGADKDHLWIIDPIDGTRSFLSGNPLFGFLMAHLKKGVPQAGVIGMPMLNEILIGQRGHGARLNGQLIHVSTCTSLDRAILYVNEGDKIYTSRPEIFAKLMAAAQTRRMAYDCYPYALLAMGHVDVVVDYDLQPYDYLPILPVVESAGGMMTDWDGAPPSLASGTTPIVAAATPELHAQMLQLING